MENETEKDYEGIWSEGEPSHPLKPETTAAIEAAAADKASAAAEYMDAHKEFESK